MCAGGAGDRRTTRRRSPRRSRGDEVEYDVGLPGEGAETEVFFSDLSHDYVTHQRGLHDVTTTRMRDVGTLLEALPYIREFHGKTVVIKYGGAAMEDPALREDFARDVVLLKYVGLNPIVVHGGGPDITAYMERLEHAGRVRRRPARVRRRHRRDREDGPRRQGQQGHRPAPQPPRAAGGRAVRRRRPAVPRRDAGRRRAARTSASSGAIERVDVDVINHIAEDYIPVIASVGADRDGRSHNVNADEAAGAVARALGAYKVIFLTDVARLAARPGRPASRDLRGDAPTRSRRRCRRSPAACARSSQACVDAIHGGVTLRAHHRRPRAALAAARAVHRRRHRHEGPAGRVTSPTAALEPTMSAPTRATRSSSSAGEGARLWDAEGNEYLDFLAAISVDNLGHCHPRVVAAVREQAGRLMHVCNLFYTEPAMRLAERLAARSLGGKVFFCNSGAEANEAAIKLARKARPRRRHRRRRTAAFHGRTYGALSATPQESKQAPFAPLVPGFRAVAPTAEALAAAVDERHGRGAARADPGRVAACTRCRDELLRRRARGLRRARRGADLRRGPVPAWGAPARCGPTSRPASCPTR